MCEKFQRKAGCANECLNSAQLEIYHLLYRLVTDLILGQFTTFYMQIILSASTDEQLIEGKDSVFSPSK